MVTQNGKKPWYFVDIDGDQKLRSWPKPSVGVTIFIASFTKSVKLAMKNAIHGECATWQSYKWRKSHFER